MRASTVLLGAFAVAAVGCSAADDHPPPSDAVVTNRAAIVQPPRTEPVCEPRSNRECHVTYFDEKGALHCPTDVEICAVDGMSWLPCGMYIYDDDHYPIPNPLPRHR